jgi:CBS domain-containing protein
VTSFAERWRERLAMASTILDTLLVKDVMATDVITTSPQTPLAEAVRVLMERKIGRLPVVKDGHLVGIFTEGDFVALVAGKV